MDKTKMTQLVEKYWEGTTSLEEEAELKAFFQQADLPAELEAEAPFFRMLHKEQSRKTARPDFEAHLEQQLTQSSRRFLFPRSIYRWGAAAAIALLLLGLHWSSQLSNPTSPIAAGSTVTETYESPEEAYAKAKELLLLLSNKMNQGTQKATEGVLKIGTASSAIKTLND